MNTTYRNSSTKKAVAVEHGKLAAFIFFWWALSLVAVWTALKIFGGSSLVAGILEMGTHIPAVSKLSSGTHYQNEISLFHFFFLITSPIALFFYYQFMSVKRKLSSIEAFLIILGIVCALILLTLGVEASDSLRFGRKVNALLNSSWLGSSFMFLLLYHLLVISLVIFVKNRRT